MGGDFHGHGGGGLRVGFGFGLRLRLRRRSDRIFPPKFFMSRYFLFIVAIISTMSFVGLFAISTSTTKDLPLSRAAA